jgi:hypothetical protein
MAGACLDLSGQSVKRRRDMKHSKNRAASFPAVQEQGPSLFSQRLVQEQPFAPVLSAFLISGGLFTSFASSLHMQHASSSGQATGYESPYIAMGFDHSHLSTSVEIVGCQFLIFFLYRCRREYNCFSNCSSYK